MEAVSNRKILVFEQSAMIGSLDVFSSFQQTRTLKRLDELSKQGQVKVKQLDDKIFAVENLSDTELAQLKSRWRVRVVDDAVMSIPKPIVMQSAAVVDEKIYDLGLRSIGAGKLSQDGYCGQQSKVFVVDTGVAPHAHLKANLREFLDGVEGDLKWTKDFKDPNDVDENTSGAQGHGTHCAGIIAADGKGKMVGPASKTNLYGVRVLDENGSGTTTQIYAALKAAIDKAVTESDPEQPIIFSCSWGGPRDPNNRNPIIDLMNKATKEHGILFVCAAGNTGKKEEIEPGTAEQAICVAATDIQNTPQTTDDKITDFSTRGSQVDVAAFGFNVLSTGGTKDYILLSGTSMATPLITAGLAAAGGRYHDDYEKGLVNVGFRTLVKQGIVQQALYGSCRGIKGASADEQGYGTPHFDRFYEDLKDGKVDARPRRGEMPATPKYA